MLTIRSVINTFKGKKQYLLILQVLIIDSVFLRFPNKQVQFLVLRECKKFSRDDSSLGIPFGTAKPCIPLSSSLTVSLVYFPLSTREINQNKTIYSNSRVFEMQFGLRGLGFSLYYPVNTKQSQSLFNGRRQITLSPTIPTKNHPS